MSKLQKEATAHTPFRSFLVPAAFVMASVIASGMMLEDYVESSLGYEVPMYDGWGGIVTGAVGTLIIASMYSTIGRKLYEIGSSHRHGGFHD